MRILVPITGTALTLDPISGDPDDPIRLIDIDLGNVSWKLIRLDLDNDMAEIEITPGDKVSFPTGEFGMFGTSEKDAKGKPIYEELEIYETRQATEAEKQSLLDYARNLVEGHTKDELYQMSGCSRLKRPFKVEK